ncbi:MAG: hypothetical protein EXX96DRAFT_180692 [Benjaminiella poitrasii]|nr:MAG: hypothetical protein EXX96DRAFT_180692 [Benjaminiella poitrasii]
MLSIRMAPVESILWIGSFCWVFYQLFKTRQFEHHVIAGWMASIWIGIGLVRISTRLKKKEDDDVLDQEDDSSSTTTTVTAVVYSSSEDDKQALKKKRKRVHPVKEHVCSENRIFGASKSSFRANADDGLKCGVLLLPMVAAAKFIDSFNKSGNEHYMAYVQVRLELVLFMSVLFLMLVFINDYLHPLKRVIRKRGLFISSICVAALCTTLLTRFTSLAPQLSQQSTYLTVLSVTVFQWFLYICVVTLKKCFTLGEMCIISQASAIVVHGATEYIYSAHYPEQTPSYIHYSEISTATVLMHAVVVGMVFIGISTYPLLRQSRRLAQRPYWRSAAVKTTQRAKVACAITFYILTALIVLFVIAPLCKSITGENPFMWTLDFLYMSPSRMVLCLYWALMVITTVVIWVLVLDFYPQPTQSSSLEAKTLTSALNKKRKLFHALAVLMFVPGVLFEKLFLQLAFSVALSGFIYLEYLRYFALWPWGKSLHVFLTEFIDNRDLGPVILSHIYLLLGCAGPVWLSSSNVLGSLAGVLSLGFGDAAASLIGKRIGRWIWPGTNKTVEGTIAFVVSVFVSSMVIVYVAALIGVDDAVRWVASAGRSECLSYLVVITLTGLLEAFSTQNDNIIIPLYMYVLVVLTV